MKYPTKMCGLKFDILYIDIAKLVSRLSTANRLKVGCVIVKHDSIISYGYNGTPHGDSNICEIDNVTKSDVIHAEVNALLKLIRFGATDCNMYITHSPCIRCANLIFQSGVIKNVYYGTEYRDMNGVNYLISKSINVKQILSTNDDDYT